jgi:hypothetical protein
MSVRTKFQQLRHHYAILWRVPGPNRWTSERGVAMWRRATRKDVAIRLARTVGGRAYAVNHGARDPWDAPTFAHVGTCIADYTGGAR